MRNSSDTRLTNEDITPTEWDIEMEENQKDQVENHRLKGYIHKG